MLHKPYFNSQGTYKTRGVETYDIWRKMVGRCYDNPDKHYENCTVSKEWLDYQDFCNWFYSSEVLPYYQKGFNLDKDLLITGNKVYSKDSCVFIPREINSFLTLRKNDRGEYKIGVYLKSENRTKKYGAQLNMGILKKHLGYFLTEQEAFSAYKEAKELKAKDLANKYFGIISPKAVNALFNYRIQDAS